jgi:hypothetical protein
MIHVETVVALYTSFVGALFVQSCAFCGHGQQAVVCSYSNQFSVAFPPDASVQGKSFVVQRSQSSSREDETPYEARVSRP